MLEYNDLQQNKNKFNFQSVHTSLALDSLKLLIFAVFLYFLSLYLSHSLLSSCLCNFTSLLNLSVAVFVF